MATKTREFFDEHKLDKSKDVSLTITIGNLQIGGSKVKWKGEKELLGKGSIVDLSLGKPADLIGKTLCITTNFYDNNPNSNFVSGIYDLNNGEPPMIVYYEAVDNDGDFFVFIIEITFR